MPKTIEYDVTVENGKYRFVYYSDGSCGAYRHGEQWPAMSAEMVGSKAIQALVIRIDELEKFTAKVVNEMATDRLRELLGND